MREIISNCQVGRSAGEEVHILEKDYCVFYLARSQKTKIKEKDEKGNRKSYSIL